ncbi:hypothetical protein HMPREF1611_02143 [Escherichia coli 908573]|nr:hypothetical protein HMPREF1611_02143 [Escherichia coli 908573]
MEVDLGILAFIFLRAICAWFCMCRSCMFRPCVRQDGRGSKAVLHLH